VPGASAYFLGGAVIYTVAALRGLLEINDADMKDIRAASEPYALLLARRIRDKHTATWGLSETGAAGPSGNRYGDPAGHSCIGIVGPVERAVVLRTQSADRQDNMRAFSRRALELLAEAIGA
jgi:nicotinamide-nucleotide amidase